MEELHGVRVLGTTVEGDAVHVDLYGGEDNVCGYVRFVFEDPAERAARVEVLRAWAERGTGVSFATSGGTVTLTDRTGGSDESRGRVSRGGR